ncbi:molybdopterin molybdotransferase MoeA [Spiractinospora alimapuensis]|uniref:molybdopterin molybdotransferase MoeA n=1 Tax=Spiractinospora alimapuensis TaxID=2820884 RepID=UPI001F1E49F8|nr:molybdopterin molybdotransferase MoeA [Spiractinospora alimapuensis]QVQ53364.1 molybdopterin molybdotransferase MoeA [Spiractinospora alimapuensis]
MGGRHRPRTSWSQARALAVEVGEWAARRAGEWTANVGLDGALGATTADDVIAPMALPAFDAAAMDGYAVCGEGPWTVVARQLAGQQESPTPLTQGEAMEIATGALAPKGTTAVLPYEAAHRQDRTVSGEITQGRHVRWTGEEIALGDTVVPAGREVTSAALGMLAGLAVDRVRVARPTVLPLVTGDEVLSAGLPEQGQVRDAIGPMLPGLVRWAGGEPLPGLAVTDDRAALRTILRALSDPGPSDDAPPCVIAVCGASSAGPADHLRSVLSDLGAQTVVDGVACRPGHPQLLARFGTDDAPGPVVVGLPGNPYAALVAALTLLVPVLCAATGRADPSLAAPERARLDFGDAPRPAAGQDTRLIAVRVREGIAYPLGGDSPGNLRGAALADALAVLPPNEEEAEEVALISLPR